MIENNLAEVTIELRLLYKDCFVTIFHLLLNEGTNINSTIKHIREKYYKNFSHCLSYSNIPNLITLHTWAKTPQDSHQILEELQTEGFKDIIPHIFLSANYYDCWLDQLLRTK